MHRWLDRERNNVNFDDAQAFVNVNTMPDTRQRVPNPRFDERSECITVMWKNARQRVQALAASSSRSFEVRGLQ